MQLLCETVRSVGMGEKMRIIAYGLVCAALGGVIGAILGAKFARRQKEAPIPIDLSYDAINPINGRNNAPKTETICGYTWTVYGGQ